MSQGVLEPIAPARRKAAASDPRELCLRFLACESEASVQAIVESLPEMRNPKNWHPLDRRETNFNVTSNQASDGGKALTELMTNMVDAVLMKHAHQRGIDPKGPKAPRTMYEAVDKLIKPLHGGKLVNLDPNDPWLRDFASKNLVIGVTGAKNKKEGLPCYTFVDNGEGQRASDFERTFLSLSEGNKKSIPFVQGKYNMGSSGVLGYCGRRWFKLIVSRRHDGASPWGWTLMRRRPGGGMPIAEYFVLGNGLIPSFAMDILHPFAKNDGNRYDGMHLATGTIVKLYDYQVGSKFLSFKGAREALNENLVETILPFRLLDFRQKPDRKRGGDRAEGIDPRPFYGMEYLLLRAHREELHAGDAEDEEDDEEKHAAGEARISVGKIEDPEIGEISISAIKLKRVLPSWLKETNNRVFHAVNGQVQFKQTRGYLTSCGFPALKDRIVLFIDASNLTLEAHNDVWKGDREHIRNTIVGERYRELITAQIKDSKALADLQRQVASEEMERAATSERNDLFQKLVDADRNLAGLLTDRDPEIRLPASGGAKGGDDKGEGKFEGKYSPTFLRLDEKSKLIELPINRRRPVTGRTDAENGYLDRADNCGSVLLPDEIAARFTVSQQLHAGRMTLYFDPLEDQNKVGDKVTFKVGLHDPAMAAPVEDELTILILDEEAAVPKPKSKAGPKPANGGEGKDKKGDGSDAPTHGLPKYVLLTRDGRNVGEQETQSWPLGLNEHDGGAIRDLGADGMIYMINYDNAYHVRYRQQQRGDIARDVVTEKYILGMRILMMGYEHAFRTLREANRDGIAEYLDEFRRMAARGAASTVLALAENLPKIIDTSSVSCTVLINIGIIARFSCNRGGAP